VLTVTALKIYHKTLYRFRQSVSEPRGAYVDDQHDKLRAMPAAAIASRENALRECELAFGHGPFVFFGDALDAIARIAWVAV
jgi:hypothetical protein